MTLADRVRFDADGTVTVRSGKVELGQGILTALAQIAAEELDVAVHRVRMAPAATGASPDEGHTAGSMSVQRSGAALREACAEVRSIYLASAAAALGAKPDELVVTDGRFTGPDGRATTYWELADPALLDREPAGGVAPKRPAEHRTVGTSVPRLDLPDKVAGRPRFIHDLAPPGLRYGRVVRPPSRGARLVDVAPAEYPSGVAVVRDGSFLGVVAAREEDAVRAAAALRAAARWREHPALPDQRRLREYLTSAPAETTVLAERRPTVAAPVARTLSASYHRPYLAHASLGPSCAMAIVDGAQWTIWTHSQGIYPLRRELARALGLRVEQLTVHHVEGAGCYGHNGADDAALDAALLARAVPGRPVQVLWSRQDELGWAPFGPAAVVELAADVDVDGNVLHWRHEIWGSGHGGRPGAPDSVALLAASHLADPSPAPVAVDMPVAGGGGAGRNAVPPYRFPATVTSHRLLDPPLRTSSLRSLGAHLNVFAAESFLDELAHACGADPVEYRLRQLDDPRGRAVVEAAARRAGWDGSAGRGIGYARYKNSGAYCAVVAEVVLAPQVLVRRLVVAVDAGLVVNPDGLVNQIEGGAVQATSWTTREQVRFDRSRVTSDTFTSYPILRFSEVPAVNVVVLNRPDQPALGAGEAAAGPTAAAVGNALFSAAGVRVRDLPLDRWTVAAALGEQPAR